MPRRGATKSTTAAAANTTTTTTSNRTPSRGAVQVQISKEQHVRDLQKKATDIEHRLALAVKDSTTTKSASQPQNNNNNAMINQYRMMLCETLSDWILTDPGTAHTQDAVGRLWRQCFYARIGPARVRLTKDKKKHGTTNPTLIAKQEESLQIFLAEGIALYEYLCDKLQYQLHGGRLTTSASSNNSTSSSVGGDATMTLSAPDNNDETIDSERPWMSNTMPEGDENDDTSSTTTAGIIPCLHRLYIHWGDLYRYGQYYSKAEWAYTISSRLGPGSGHAYNQLAVVSQIKQQGDQSHSAAITVYWYARSLAASVEPFPTAASNLQRLWMSNREWLLTTEQQHRTTTQKKQQPQVTVMTNNASRLFLAQFVDLQYRLLDGGGGGGIGTDGSGGTQSNKGVDEFYNHLEEAVTGLRDLLKNSALGDGLLCKLVTVMVFSEFHCRRQPSPMDMMMAGSIALQQTWAMARLVTLDMGQCLAERVEMTLQNKLNNKPGAKTTTSSSSLPSVRVLLPLMLLVEYLLDVGSNNNNNAANEYLSSSDRYQPGLKSFWRSVIGIFNLLQPLNIPQLPNSSTDPKQQQQLKEYQELRGFAPFATFVKDDAIADAGYVSDSAARAELFLIPTNTKSSSAPSGQDAASVRSSQGTHMSGSVVAASDNDSVHTKKLQRFLGLRRQLLSYSASPVRIRENPVSQNLELVDDAVDEYDRAGLDNGDDDDDHHMNFDSGAENTSMITGGTTDDMTDDVLVYSTNETGGPALLMPGAGAAALLHQQPSLQQQQSAGTPTASSHASSGLTAIVKNTAPTQPSLPGTTTFLPPTTSDSTSIQEQPLSTLPMQSSMSQQDLTSAAPPLTGIVVLPPPGFSPQVQRNAVPNMQDLNSNNGLTGLPMTLPPINPSFYQTFLHDPASEPAYIPTIGESLDLFGGPSALQTANPFATNTFPSFEMGSYMVPPSDVAFLNQDAMGLDGTTLLDSSLLSSLLMDNDSPRKTKNPFAT